MIIKRILIKQAYRPDTRRLVSGFMLFDYFYYYSTNTHLRITYDTKTKTNFRDDGK